MVDRNANFKTQEICFLDETITIHGRTARKRLPSNFTPSNWSVLCGRGKDCYNHFGNKRLRILVETNLEKYSAAKTKFDKSLIVSSIVDAVREAGQGGGFIKQDIKTQTWVEVGDDAAREKVGQMLREAMFQKDPAKSQERRNRRKAKAMKSKQKAKRVSISDCSASTAETYAMSLSDSDSVLATSVPSTLYAPPQPKRTLLEAQPIGCFSTFPN